MTLWELVDRRNDLLFAAEDISKAFGDHVWAELGISTRHIDRVINGVFPLQVVEKEIVKCLDRVTGIVEEKKKCALTI